MKNIYRKLFLIIVLIGFSGFSFSQSKKIDIQFIGNCGLYFTDGISNLYVDFPYKSGAFGYMKYDPSVIDKIKENAIFLFTHKHADHYSKEILKQIENKHQGKIFGSWNTQTFEKLNSSIDDFKIETFETKHRFASRHYSYLIIWHGKRIFISGDTESADAIAAIKDIDWAFVPPWILANAKEKHLKIDAENFAVYHLYPDQKINNSSPEKILLLNRQGMMITIPY